MMAVGKPRWTLRLFVLLMCFSGCGFAIAEHLCIYDLLRKRKAGSANSFVREIQSGDASMARHFVNTPLPWEPIRIQVFLEDLWDPLAYCATENDRRRDFRGSTVDCDLKNVFTPEKKATLVGELLPGAIRLHRDRLLVRPVTGRLVVPVFGNLYCANFNVPGTHHTTGVDGADMILYVAAAPTTGFTVAWSVTCGWIRDGRPAAGVLNFGPQGVGATPHGIRVTAHEIAHALGFNYDQMEALRMVSKVSSKGRGKSRLLIVSTPKVREKTRQHFNCSTVKGMELEDEGGRGTAQSHWERRNAKDELMAGLSGVGYYTALTMAFFDDMKFYRANWGMEEPMSWGSNTGCNLLKKPCLIDGITEYPNMFCNSTLEEPMRCTSDRLALGHCSNQVYETPLPPQYRYFRSANIGGRQGSLTDYCPFIMPYSNTNCRDGSPLVVHGSRFGPNSRCLNGENLQMGKHRVGDICADIMCDNNTVRVRLLGDDNWYLCPEKGFVEPEHTFTGGRILCPTYIEVCPAFLEGEGYTVAEKLLATSGIGSYNHNERQAAVIIAPAVERTSFFGFVVEMSVFEWAIGLMLLSWMMFLLDIVWIMLLAPRRWLMSSRYRIYSSTQPRHR